MKRGMPKAFEAGLTVNKRVHFKNSGQDSRLLPRRELFCMNRCHPNSLISPLRPVLTSLPWKPLPKSLVEQFALLLINLWSQNDQIKRILAPWIKPWYKLKSSVPAKPKSTRARTPKDWKGRGKYYVDAFYGQLNSIKPEQQDKKTGLTTALRR